MRALFLAAFCLAVSGCGDGYHYHRGRWDEARAKLPEALRHYEAFTAHKPEDPRAAELHVRAGRLYASLDRCLEARRHFEAAARGFPKSPWAGAAKLGLMSCPDYFPLAAGRTWVYGDSASGGRAMKLEWEVRQSSGAGGVVTSSLFAGSRRLSTADVAYEAEGWTLWQKDAEGRFVLLEFPYSVGRAWTARRGGRRLTYRIESDDATAATHAGVFRHCLKVRETTQGFSESWKYDYYCPSVGRALTTVAGPGFENPNTELLSYRR